MISNPALCKAAVSAAIVQPGWAQMRLRSRPAAWWSQSCPSLNQTNLSQLGLAYTGRGRLRDGAAQPSRPRQHVLLRRCIDQIENRRRQHKSHGIAVRFDVSHLLAPANVEGATDCGAQVRTLKVSVRWSKATNRAKNSNPTLTYRIAQHASNFKAKPYKPALPYFQRTNYHRLLQAKYLLFTGETRGIVKAW